MAEEFEELYPNGVPDRPTYDNPGHLHLFSEEPGDAHDFDAFFTDDTLCLTHVLERLYPGGFRCLRCGSCRFDILPKNLLECFDCRQKNRPLRNTIFHRTKVPLSKWFKAAFLMRNPAMNASRLKRELRVAYHTAHLLAHKLRFVMQRLQESEPRNRDAGVDGPPLRLSGVRGPESKKPHGCERLERPDFADHTDLTQPCGPEPHYPWKRWLRERGPFPAESRWADEVRIQLAYQYHHSIGERYLPLYLAEFAFRYDRRWLGLSRFVHDLVAAMPFTHPRTRRELGGFPVPRPVRPWLAIVERTAS